MESTKSNHEVVPIETLILDAALHAIERNPFGEFALRTMHGPESQRAALLQDIRSKLAAALSHDKQSQMITGSSSGAATHIVTKREEVKDESIHFKAEDQHSSPIPSHSSSVVADSRFDGTTKKRERTQDGTTIDEEDRLQHSTSFTSSTPHPPLTSLKTVVSVKAEEESLGGSSSSGGGAARAVSSMASLRGALQMAKARAARETTMGAAEGATIPPLPSASSRSAENNDPAVPMPSSTSASTAGMTPPNFVSLSAAVGRSEPLSSSGRNPVGVVTTSNFINNEQDDDDDDASFDVYIPDAVRGLPDPTNNTLFVAAQGQGRVLPTTTTATTTDNGAQHMMKHPSQQTKDEFMQQFKRAPRRGEIGVSAEQVAEASALGYVMSGSRNRATDKYVDRIQRQLHEKQAAQMRLDFLKESDRRTDERTTDLLLQLVSGPPPPAGGTAS